jgi:hypothetical protein
VPPPDRPRPRSRPELVDVCAWIDRLFIAAPGANLRDEDRKKARELAGLLVEIDWAVRRVSAKRELVLVDAASGKGTVGLLTAALLLGPAARAARVVLIERDERRVELARVAAARLRPDAPKVRFDFVVGDVADPTCWPAAPDVVVALHACGEASDLVITRATAVEARFVLVAQCCVAAGIPVAVRAEAKAESAGVSTKAEIRRKVIEALVASERLEALEASGYLVDAVAFTPPTVTPMNLLLRAARQPPARRRLATPEPAPAPNRPPRKTPGPRTS